MLESLTPGVQHGQKAQPGSQPFGIGGHFQKGLGYGAQQNAINDSRILQGEGGHFVRQREDNVRIRDRQKFRSPAGEPLVALPAMALGTVAVTARFVFDHLVGAVIALLHEFA